MRVRLPDRAIVRLVGRRATVRLRIVVVANSHRTVKTARIAIRAKPRALR